MTAALWSDFDEIGRVADAPVLSIPGDLPSCDPANAKGGVVNSRFDAYRDDMALFGIDDDLESCREDARMDADERLICEQCGEYADRLTVIDDRYPPAGYDVELPVCDECLNKRHG